jgi:hypothetical protein
LAVSSDDNWQCICKADSVDARNKRGGMRTDSTKTNRIRLKGDTLIADVNIVITGGDILTGLKAQRDVAASSRVAKGIKTGGCVVVPLLLFRRA